MKEGEHFPRPVINVSRSWICRRIPESVSSFVLVTTNSSFERSASTCSLSLINRAGDAVEWDPIFTVDNARWRGPWALYCRRQSCALSSKHVHRLGHSVARFTCYNGAKCRRSHRRATFDDGVTYGLRSGLEACLQCIAFRSCQIWNHSYPTFGYGKYKSDQYYLRKIYEKKKWSKKSFMRYCYFI